MVFESIIVDVLNKFLGNYVENLNRSQLKLGIWGGDVVLENLTIKQNALEELQIPVQTVYGHLGKLVLKIPWKNLYGASVEATVENLFLLVNPNTEVKYDHEKEEAFALAAKQAELVRIEEAQKKADKDDKKIDETFVEKLVAQIIKNVQLTIKDIHVRYEDSVTNRRAPFSFGVTLHNLSVHTTDENWTHTVVQDAVTKIFKILTLEGLTIYLNPSTELYANRADAKARLENEIATKSKIPESYKYLLGPISATAKLKLNPKPEDDSPKFSIPKVRLDLDMEQLSLQLSRSQYKDIMLLADSMETASKAAPYRRYRPALKTYKGHYKEWWKFAATCIIEQEVKRRHKNWSWPNMLKHRQLCKHYADAYRAKLNNGSKVPAEALTVLDNGEKHLDLFNLVIIRQRIALEVERLGKMEKKAKQDKGWFSWWYGTDKEADVSEETDILKQFEKAMTPAEKEKLCRAIDYQENSSPLDLPAEYVAIECYFMLQQFQVTVTNDKEKVLRACIDKFGVGMLQRPSANSFRADLSMERFSILGVVQNGLEPQLVASQQDSENVNLLNVMFETKPLDGKCDQRIKVSALPLQIIYDAQTIIETVGVFQSEKESSALTTLQTAAENKLSDLKEKSTLGMQYAVHKHTFIEVDVDIAASHILVPLYGFYKGTESCVVVKLGAIRVKSEPRSEELLSVHKMVKEGRADEEILHEITEQSYDKLSLQLSEIQIVVAMVGEDWQSAIVSGEASPMHLLQPSNLVIGIHKCLITNDPRLPKIKVKGELEKIAICISEERLLTLCEIMISMPLPQSVETTQMKAAESKGSSMSLLKYLDPVEKQKRDAARSSHDIDNEQTVQITEVEAFFIMKELNIMVIKKLHETTSLHPDKLEYATLLNFSLKLLELTAVQKTYTLETTVRLGSVALQFHMTADRIIEMIQTPDVDKDNEEQYLFVVTYNNVDKKCPEFRSRYGSVEQYIELDFKTLVLLLHLECLQKILILSNKYQMRMQEIQRGQDRTANAGPLETIMEDEQSFVVNTKTSYNKTSARKQVESIQMKVNIKISAIKLSFATLKRPLSDVELEGLTAGLILKSSYTQVKCSLASITVEDLNPVTVHKEILKVIGGDIINVHIVMYNVEQYPKVSDVNMSIEAEINCMRIVFLNWFVASMLEFLDNFQTAQQAIIEASSQAADAARANVQNAYENATKVSLQVRLAAPIIVVPENSKSRKAIMIDFGKMTIMNKFVEHQFPVAEKTVTVDELVLELDNVKVSYIQLAEDFSIRLERELIRPTSFKLLINRNLSLWYANLPDLDVSGRMKTITITIGHGDYKSIMKVLNQNLHEGQKKVEEPKPAAFQPKLSKATVKSQGSKQLVKATVTPAPSVEPKHPKTKTKFCFTMESFVIDLVTTTASTDTMFTSSVGLARFCLALFSVKGRMLSDDSMHTSVLLVDCTLDDMRPNRGDKITRYLERRPDTGLDHSKDKKSIVLGTDGQSVRSMIDITYTTKEGDTFVDLRIFSFNMILAMDFLNKIMDFARVTLEEGDEKEAVTVEEVRPSQAKMAAGDRGEGPKKVSTVRSDENILEKNEKKPSMTLNVKIEQPDIYLVESLENKNCDALVLNMELRFKLRQSEGTMVADGGISGLQMVVRPFETSDEIAHTERYLLSPSHVSLAACQPPGRGVHVDIAVSDIKITMSPEIIALLNRVMATVTRGDQGMEKKEDEILRYQNPWDTKPFKPNSYWFLKTEMAAEAITIEEEEVEEVPREQVNGEVCLMACPSIIVSLEMGIGKDTVPALVLQASLSAHVKNWSSTLNMEMTWAMQMSYYNIKRAVWEPLIEPVEVLKDYQYVHLPFELKMEVKMRTPESQSLIDTTDESSILQAVASRQANTSYIITSSEALEITITKTGLEVLTLLGNTFSAAADRTSGNPSSIFSKQDTLKRYYGAPYVLHNTTGLTAKLMLQENHDFAVFLTEGYKMDEYREVVLEPGASVPLQLKRGGLNLIKLNEPPPELKLNVKIVELNEEMMIPVERADKRYFPLKTGKSTTIEKNVPHVAAIEARGLISDVTMLEGTLQIYLRSIVQVINTLSATVSVYYMTSSGNEARLLGEIKTGAILRLPLQAVHTPTAEIFFSIEGFSVSMSPFIWRELQQEVKVEKLLQCDSKDKRSGEKFYIKAVGTMEQVYLENTHRHTFSSACYDIKLKPVVKLHNCLPTEIVVSQLGLKRTTTFVPGEMLHLSHLAPNRASIVITIPNYLDKCWTCTNNLPEHQSEYVVWSFQSHDSPTIMTLDLGMFSSDDEGTQMLSLYCPFWMVNKTGLTLSYSATEDRQNVIFHPKDYVEPILFSFHAKNFFGKNKATIRVEFGEWSEKFSLDLPGSSGVVQCKLHNKIYQVAVTNQLTFNSLTKMVIFTPFFQIINKAPFSIEYQEMHRPGDPWLEVKKNGSEPLWPNVEKEEKLLRLRVSDTLDVCAPFLYNEAHSTCLKLNNDYGGLNVEVQLSEGGTYITIRQYRPGLAPALLVNYTPHSVIVYEKNNVNVKKLPSMHEMMYAWDFPAGSRSLIFEGFQNLEIENDLRQDGFGEYLLDSQHRISWVSFLDGLQRVVLFTDDPILATGVYTIGDSELVETEYIMSMPGIGISLVNDPEHLEIMYMTISHSGIIWEQCKIGARRYKKVDQQKIMLYEEIYQRYLNDKLVSEQEVSPRVMIDEKTEVDFEEMRVLKPSPRLLRRNLQPGLWFSYGLTAHSVRIHARMHRLQIDQQLPLPTFPVILAPVPPPRSVANEALDIGMRPFVEISIVERVMEHSNVRQYKYFKILVQEFHVKVDMGLVNALMGMFPQPTYTEQEALEVFQADLELASRPMEMMAESSAASDQDNFYDNLHLSPLKVHVSFSMGGATSLPTFIGTILQSIGVTLTDMNDVVFKLSYYERTYEFLSQKELMNEVQQHYTGQALKQLYVLVLGLDVIGNPYGLVVGLKKGVEDLFYEPFQGAIQGPSEFAEGLFIGVRSLVGHTVGGAAGAVSRITGAMGHGLAALSLDKDFQRRRRENINKTPANLQEGLARSGKGLVMGVVDGVTGVFTKPFEGAQEQGVEGFLKGLGKGAMGLVTRPTAGFVDFASGSLDAVKRAADPSEDLTKRRAARYLPADSGVRPFSRRHAEGYKMLFELEKGKFVTTDTYEAHVWVIPGRELVMCTDKRIMYLEKNTVFGGWQIVWMFLWPDIPEVPSATTRGVYVPVAKRKVLGMFPSSSSGKVIFLYDEQQKKYLLTQCERLFRLAR